LGTAVTDAGTGATQIVVGSVTDAPTNVAAWGGICGSFRIFNPLSTAVYTNCTGQFMQTVTSSLARELIFAWRGLYEVTVAVNALRFKFASGNIADGSIRLYGIAKA
jgi:hypothetical protein